MSLTSRPDELFGRSCFFLFSPRSSDNDYEISPVWSSNRGCDRVLYGNDALRGSGESRRGTRTNCEQHLATSEIRNEGGPSTKAFAESRTKRNEPRRNNINTFNNNCNQRSCANTHTHTRVYPTCRR